MTQSVQICLDSRQRVFALVTAMAGMVESSIDQAIEALLAGDWGLAHTLLQKEIVINRMEVHIDAAVLGHLAQKNLSPCDMRSMVSILKINKDLERMGDLAANIGRKVIELGQGRQECENSDLQRADLQPLAIAVSHICRKTLRAVVRQDVVLAESALGSEEAVHTYRDYVFRKIRERLSSGSSTANSDLALLLASRYLEQIADHAVNLADTLVFWMRGTPKERLLA
ncbi:MAG TPA: PhoU domain-containing protein [Candidatus Angelobacter sp.]|nr:PhoU domain-containing protein [Candidatus Angelobacter sp.]